MKKGFFPEGITPLRRVNLVLVVLTFGSILIGRRSAEPVHSQMELFSTITGIALGFGVVLQWILNYRSMRNDKNSDE